MKKIFKKILQSSFGFGMLKLLKLVYTPSLKNASKLKFKGTFTIKTIIGNNFKLYNNAFPMETHIFWLGIDNYQWENKTREIWCDLAKKSETIFDVGANVGIFSVLAKANNHEAKVVAFEPQPNIFEVLTKNNTVNNFDIQCENLAVSNTSGKASFYNHGPNTFSDNNTTSGSLNKEWRPVDQNSIEIEVVRLNDYIANNAVQSIDLLKIDVETLEYEVLDGYGDLLLKHLPIVILEIQSIEIGAKIENTLNQENYSYFAIDEKKGLVSINKLGTSEDNNYLLCPIHKTALIDHFK